MLPFGKMNQHFSVVILTQVF